MKKVKVTSLLKMPTSDSTSISVVGSLNENRLVFYDNEVRVVIDIDSSSILLKRIHPEYTVEMAFVLTLTKEGIYDIKCDSVHIPLSTYTSRLLIENGHIHIEYSLTLGGEAQGEYVYDITYEVIE